ncbi:hypothetical protein TNIN_170331 [Trichonephila inaurata madagascariensis]|uniref:Uncharacterized protein n=1 Tax=Trichonephila inaurata madagascariensis TaxID=2747483 RepID=A0A8X6I9I3_9ARAC|nr:hypothetical protein TNIN_170331 [Trichonephila inaurata madagascariensis]
MELGLRVEDPRFKCALIYLKTQQSQLAWCERLENKMLFLVSLTMIRNDWMRVYNHSHLPKIYCIVIAQVFMQFCGTPKSDGTF